MLHCFEAQILRAVRHHHHLRKFRFVFYPHAHIHSLIGCIFFCQSNPDAVIRLLIRFVCFFLFRKILSLHRVQFRCLFLRQSPERKYIRHFRKKPAQYGNLLRHNRIHRTKSNRKHQCRRSAAQADADSLPRIFPSSCFLFRLLLRISYHPVSLLNTHINNIAVS